MNEFKNIMVTGGNGFIGKNLIAELSQQKKFNIYNVTRKTSEDELNEYARKADFIFHLAGVNRPKYTSEYVEENENFTSQLLEVLRTNKSQAPVLMASSIQAIQNNPYGKSKLAAERLLEEHSKNNNSRIMIYRLPNVFGKWSKPNYNSVIATFCYKISRDESIELNKDNPELKLVYIDDVVKDFKDRLAGKIIDDNWYYEIRKTYNVSLNYIASLIHEFKASRSDLDIPNTSDEFTKKLYSTYLSFLPTNNFSYHLNMHRDDRGSFTEFLKSEERGQISINVSKPNIIKGNHWHHTKNEKFLVVSGTGVIRFRKLDEKEIIEYFVSEEKFEVIDVPVGYTHNIENLGDKDLITIMWANENFNPKMPDTYYEEV